MNPVILPGFIREIRMNATDIDETNSIENQNLTQEEVDYLIKTEKYPDRKKAGYTLPLSGETLTIPFHSQEHGEKFSIDIERGRISLKKHKEQLRYKTSIVLVRMDINGKPHKNPDGNIIGGTHFHLYKEGSKMSWAVPLPPRFTDPNNMTLTISQFMDYCNVKEKPKLNRNIKDKYVVD